MSFSLFSNFSSMGYQQNRSSSISTFHDYNQQNNEYDDGDEDSGWKGFGNDDKSNSREDMGLKFSQAWVFLSKALVADRIFQKDRSYPVLVCWFEDQSLFSVFHL